jgi:hypothetical protein
MRTLIRCIVVCAALLSGCTVSPLLITDAGVPPDGTPRVCSRSGESFCDGPVAVTCLEDGPLVRSARTDCTLLGDRCLDGACVTCIPNTLGCFEGNAARCAADATWEVTETCDLEAGEACSGARCVSLCDEAAADRSYEGCTFYPVDLDTRGSYAPPFGIIVSNPNPFTIRAVLEVDDAEPGEPARLRIVDEVDVPSTDVETFSLPRRRIDGRTDGAMWVETGSALTRRAYRLRASHPVIAYQFNPLAQADVFSNDASLLLPTSALGTRTTVIGWPQNISSRGRVDQRSAGEDFRSTLTIVGTEAATSVRVRFGALAGRVLGVGDVASWSAGDEATFTLGPFDVLNLESDRFNADFTGTVVESDRGVAVYSGSEGADVPAYETRADRLCCADHLEEQLIPDSSLGLEFVLARTPARARAINQALLDGSFALPEAEEYEIVRVLAVAPGTTRIDTRLRSPYDAFTLEEGEVATLILDRDTELVASQPVSVVQLLIGQEAAGIPFEYPGGDPALIVVPPVDQFRTDYVFLTPDTYGFDAITLVAPPDAEILLDGVPLPGTCERSASDGRPLGSGEPPPWVIHRCALSFPEVVGDFSVRLGVQADGAHRIRSSVPVGVVVSGFDNFVSYAYPAGMDVTVLR